MVKNKLQGAVFGMVMSYAMAIGMEVYNVAIRMGFGGNFSTMTNTVFGRP